MRSPTERERLTFSFQTIVYFVLILLGHALGLDHQAALLIFRANLLKQAKPEGFFQQRELRKTDTACEVCVRMAVQIVVGYFVTLHVFSRFQRPADNTDRETRLAEL